jgi:Immunity protein 53
MINEIENWYLSNCNEDWEHQNGVSTESLDNPGWRVEIDLVNTKLEKITFQTTEKEEPEQGGLYVRLKIKKFIGAGGPKELNKVLKVFIDWAKDHNAI